MASSVDLRKYAANCLTFAEKVSTPEDKAHLIEMAQAFLELASKQEQRDLQDMGRRRSAGIRFGKRFSISIGRLFSSTDIGVMITRMRVNAA